MSDGRILAPPSIRMPPVAGCWVLPDHHPDEVAFFEFDVLRELVQAESLAVEVMGEGSLSDNIDLCKIAD